MREGHCILLQASLSVRLNMIESSNGQALSQQGHRFPFFMLPRNRMNFLVRPFIACFAIKDSGLPPGKDSPFHKRSAGGRMTMNARALFLTIRVEERAELLWIVSESPRVLPPAQGHFVKFPV